MRSQKKKEKKEKKTPPLCGSGWKWKKNEVLSQIYYHQRRRLRRRRSCLLCWRVGELVYLVRQGFPTLFEPANCTYSLVVLTYAWCRPPEVPLMVRVYHTGWEPLRRGSTTLHCVLQSKLIHPPGIRDVTPGTHANK